MKVHAEPAAASLTYGVSDAAEIPRPTEPQAPMTTFVTSTANAADRILGVGPVLPHAGTSPVSANNSEDKNDVKA